MATVSFSDTGYLISHAAGAVSGFLFVIFLRMGYNGGRWMNAFFDWVNDLTKTPNLTQQRIDIILDKINEHGYNSLTEEEKELLKRAGEEDI